MATFNEIWYDASQGNRLKLLINQVKSLTQGRIAEIGCWEGNSTQYIITESDPEQVLCIDHWRGCETESTITGSEHVTVTMAKQRNVKGQFIANMTALTNGNYEIVEQEASAWLSQTTEQIKFCHMDSSHDYESTLEILTKLKTITVEGGCLCGDDIISANEHREDLHGGVERALKEVLPEFKSYGNLWYWFNSSTNYTIMHTDNGDIITVPEPPTEPPTEPTI